MTTSSGTSSQPDFKQFPGRNAVVDRNGQGDFIGIIAIISETEPNSTWIDYMNICVGDKVHVEAFMHPFATALGRPLVFTAAARKAGAK